MTNRGGRAQKHYQDSCLVLPDRTHAIPINAKRINSSKQAHRTRTPCNVEGFDVVTGHAPPHSNPCWFKVTRTSFDNHLPVFKQKKDEVFWCSWHTSIYRYSDPCTCRLIILPSGAGKTQGNNRKLWVIGSILISDPQLLDRFSF